MDLPIEYQARMREILGEDYDAYLESFGHTVGQTLRVNQRKTEPAELFRRFHAVYEGGPALKKESGQGAEPLPIQSESSRRFRPVPWCETGAYYEGEMRLSLHPYYQAGLYYLQEPSAMAPAAFLPVSPGEKVLDLCAAPGGKTTALGAKLSGKGLLLANDISVSRCRALLKNVQMAGITNAVITAEKPEKLAEAFPAYFDKILVDAPCSGEGMFRRDPGMIKAWSVQEVSRYAALQKEILKSAAAMLRPQGMLLYSTCTYSPMENEQVVESLLEGGEFELLPLPEYEGVDSGHPEWSLTGDPSLICCRRFWNHRVEGEGQFAALLRKREPITSETAKQDGNETWHPTDFVRYKHTFIEEEGLKDIPESLDSKDTTSRDFDRRFGKSQGRDIDKSRRRDFDENLSRSFGKSQDRNYDRIRGRKSGRRVFVPVDDMGLPEECIDFFKKLSGSGLPEEIKKSMDPSSGRIKKAGERIFLLPKDAPDMTGLRVVSSGLHLGDCKKKRFEPGHALALALCPDQFDQVMRLRPDEEFVERYLRGETIPCQVEQAADTGIHGKSRKKGGSGVSCRQDGWCLVCVDAYPLGWGKIQKGRLKNKYPAGWIRSL